MMRAAGLLLSVVLAAVSAAEGAILVDSVHAGGPAEAAGVQAGDRIAGIDGRQIETPDDLQRALSAHRPGDTVPLAVWRDGQRLDLELTFGKRPNGRASFGAALLVAANLAEGADPERAANECLAWIGQTYSVEPLIRDLGLQPAQGYAEVRECVRDNMRYVPPDKVIAYCDNIFKVHCPGLDLLTEIAEALVGRCEKQLGASAGEAWKSCGQHRVFDRYLRDGTPTEAAACRALLERECEAGSKGSAR